MTAGNGSRDPAGGDPAGRDPDGSAPVIVVPCFNEEGRIDERAFGALAATGRVRILFVDDGSTDGTATVLGRLASSSDAIDTFSLPANAGKAEAVRRGLLVAVRSGATVAGYYDADRATPPHELLRLVDALQARPDLAGVFGSRVARLGSTIERKAARHYLGRAYATLASMALGVTVYDTQCGAKVFRVTDTFVAALARPFRSSWAFDVELLHRLLRGGPGVPPQAVTAFVELPLGEWHDVEGSKLRPGPALRALVDLGAIARLRRRPPDGTGLPPAPAPAPAPAASPAPAPVVVPRPRRATGSGTDGRPARRRQA